MVKFLKHQVKAIDSHKIERFEAPVELVVVQQPVKARVSGRKETRNSSRRLVDPQPIVQLKLDHEHRNIIDHSLGIYFIRASIECVGFSDLDTFLAKQRKSRVQNDLADDVDVLRGTTTVTAQFYKGSPYVACGVFDNLSVRFKGDYRLKFDLYEIQSFTDNGTNGGVAAHPRIVHWENATVYSSKFTVYTDASFDGLEASPVLNEQLKKAGCRIRTRKPKNSLASSAAINFADYKIAKPLKAYPANMGLMLFYPQYSPAAHANPNYNPAYASPMAYANCYFDSPAQSRSSTPIPDLSRHQSIADVYSRAATPVHNYNPGLSTPLSTASHYFTPSQNALSTPQSHHIEVFSTPLTHMAHPPATATNAMLDTAGLDLSPLEQDAIFNNTNESSAYVLSNSSFAEQNPGKLDFNNLDTFYQSLSNNSSEMATQNPNSAPVQSNTEFAPRSLKAFLEAFNDMLNPNEEQKQHKPSENDISFQEASDASMDFSSLLLDNISFPNTNNNNNLQRQQQQQQQPAFENPFAISELEFTF